MPDPVKDPIQDPAATPDPNAADDPNAVQDPAQPASDDPNGGKTPDSPTGAEADNADGSSASDDKVPFDQNPKWKAARKAEQQLTTLLESKGFESLDDLVDALDRGSTLEENLSGADLETILEKASTLDEYEKHWADEKRKKLLEGETPEQTIARLEREKEELVEKHETDKSALTQAKEAEEQLKLINSEIAAVISTTEVPEEYREFAGLLLGADNPMLDVDVSDKKAFKSTASGMLEKITAFEQAVVARHLAGKIPAPTPAADPPATPPPGGDTPAPTDPKKPIKTLADAKKIMLERLKSLRKE